MKIAKIHIRDLHLRTIIGLNDWERKQKQDILINIIYETDVSRAIESDSEEFIVNYRTLTKKIIDGVEKSSFYLLEKLTDFVLQLVLSEAQVIKASVKIDKLNALHFAEGVSVELSAKKA